MCVPVTTKPYLNKVNFSALLRVSLHYFSLTHQRKNQPTFYFLHKQDHGHGPQSKLWDSCPPLCGIIRLTLQTYSDPMVPFRVFTSFVFSESHYK